MRDLMDRQGYDALAFVSGSFFQFATNFATDVAPWERPIVCVVPRDGAPFAILNELSTHHWRFGVEADRLWVDDAAFYAEHPRVTSRLPVVTQWSEMAAAKLQAAGLHRSRIGVDAAGGPFAGVTRFLPHVRIEPDTAGCRALRLVKHPDEIALMRATAGLADWVQDRYREHIRPGKLVQQLDQEMGALMAEEAARRFPGENLRINCRTSSGPASAAPHGDGRSSGARIEKGHVLVNIVCPSLNGLTVENERTWFCGAPSARQAELFELAREATEAACAAAVTGEPVCGIDAAAQAVFERGGVAELVRHRTGHGMGTEGHEFPEDMPFNTRPLLEREVYSAEPGLYEWGVGGFRHDDTVVVGREPEVLTNSARDLASQTVS